MNIRTRKIYLTLSLAQIFFVIVWTVIHQSAFPNPVFSIVGITIFSQIAFWFTGYGPRIIFFIAEERGRLKPQLESFKFIVSLWLILCSSAALFILVEAIVIGKYENVIVFFYPFAASAGSLHTLQYIKSTLLKIH